MAGASLAKASWVTLMAQGETPFQFPGFRLPRYTNIPDELFDDLLSRLSGAELKVLLYIMRRTLGFKKDVDAISLSQICQGIQRADGSPLDHGTGLHRDTAITALRHLEKIGTIQSIHHQSAAKGFEATAYRLRFDGKSDPPEREFPTPTQPENPPSPGRIIQPALVGKSGLQETDSQETDSQETDSEIRIFERHSENLFEEDRRALQPFVIDFARELGDAANLKASTTRALNLFRRSGLDLEGFAAKLYVARAITQERTAAIRAQAQDAGRPFPRKLKMAYFFKVLERQLQEPPVSKADDRSDANQDSVKTRGPPVLTA